MAEKWDKFPAQKMDVTQKHKGSSTENVTVRVFVPNY